MNRFIHRLSIVIYSAIVLAAIVGLLRNGWSYYELPIGERPFHADYYLLKPTGFVGHGLGIMGTLLILIGLFSYMIRKRFKIFSRVGLLKYWLEFHIFMCTLGTVLVVFHTTFKFGGLISIGFWSLVIVFVSGVVGRFIYLQIPQTIEGKELTVSELRDLKLALETELKEKYQLNFSEIKTSRFSEIKLKLIAKKISKKDFYKVKKLIKKERRLIKRIDRLDRMKNLFKHWHVIHLPFALIMLIIMVIHVSIALFFGYKWIF